MRFAPLITSLALSSATSLAHAQGTPHFLQPVDGGVEDVSELGTSLRQIEFGLAEPWGFAQVYRVVNQPDLFVRSSGAIYAAFPQSAYGRYRNGRAPTIPAATVFYIGAPPEWLTDPIASPGLDISMGNAVSDLRVDIAVNAQGPPRAPEIPETSSDLPPIVGDAAYRSRRWADLLLSACRGPVPRP